MFNLQPFRKKTTSLFDFDDFFDSDFFAPITSHNNFLKADVKDNKNEYVIEMDLPGVSKDEVEIDYVNDHLVVHGKRVYDNEVKEENFIRRERSQGEFKRSFYVDNVDESKITASYNNGVLNIVLPKLEEDKPKGKKIDIN